MAIDMNRTTAASPELMAQQAQLIKQTCIAIITRVDSIKEKMAQLSCYWDTEGGALLKDIFQTDTQSAAALSVVLNRRLTDLDSIILNYSSAETTSQEEALQLPDTVFN